MIAVVDDEIADLTVMSDIALSGTGQQELGTGHCILFQKKNPAPSRGSMDRTEEPGGPCPDYDNVGHLHILSYRSMPAHY
jgi:hypothetical protein